MDTGKIIISGTGCALADFLYNRVTFESNSFRKYLSVKPGDGGLCPGKLVFTEELEKFAGKPYNKILIDIIGNRKPDALNVGGPSLVSLIHASQMLEDDDFTVKFFGMAAEDETADEIFSLLRKTRLNADNYLTTSSGATPFTDVFSDPTYDNGHGERTFVNNIGAAWNFTPELLPDEFFRSHIVCFGGTALVPNIHDNLSFLLLEAKKKNCITVVNTVFDFRNEKNNPGKPWPLGKGIESLKLIDILIMDREEAIKISGTDTVEKAASYFSSAGVPSFIITNGANNILAEAQGGIFRETGLMNLPVSEKVGTDLRAHPEMKGDTTGCGDNFAGGIIASVAWQMKSGKRGDYDFVEALSWGVASGGFSCFTIGGTYIEKQSGEKLKMVEQLQKEYLEQIRYQR
jgi:sugar/nucleoside kinase (ribokinase family)